MAVTHHFVDDDDYTQGGRWAGDYGQTICRWSWDVNARALTVECGMRGRRIDLGGFSTEWQTDMEMRQRLPSLALEVAADIKGVKYDV